MTPQKKEIIAFFQKSIYYLLALPAEHPRFRTYGKIGNNVKVLFPFAANACGFKGRAIDVCTRQFGHPLGLREK